jgi:2-polyprenyl-3-methyl-5-hydroxy-6-metoxy-1,4-benzoquinol methylase
LNYNKCRCCGLGELKPWLALPNSPVANALFKEPNFERHPLELNYCSDCYHLQLSSAPDPDGVFADYKYKSGVSASFRKHFTEYAKSVVDYLGTGKVLEIGSNDGFLLQQFKELGCEVIGVEPSLNLTQDHLDKGVSVVADFFTTDLVKKMGWEGSFDIIIANNVLAHIPDTLDVVNAISLALKDDAHLVAECGNQSGIISGEYIDNVYHEHIDYYSPFSFMTLLQRVKVFAQGVHSVNTHGISFRMLAQKRLIANNRIVNYKVDWQQSAKDVEKKISDREDRIKALIGNRNFIAYGAAAKAVTALYSLHMVNKQMIGVVDDNDLKQEYYFPGTDIMITKPEDMDKDAVVLVCAWNVFDDIKAKLESRGHRGEIICMQ